MVSLMPVLAVLCVLLGDPNSEPTRPVGTTEYSAMVVAMSEMAEPETMACAQTGLPVGAMPAPGAGRLRVREADRLGPARLHLPPPCA
jgi:hypothetical protein